MIINCMVQTSKWFLTITLLILISTKLNASRHRCVAAMSNYNFSSAFRSEKINVNADGLSCLHYGSLSECVICEVYVVLHALKLKTKLSLTAYVAPQVVVPYKKTSHMMQ